MKPHLISRERGWPRPAYSPGGYWCRLAAACLVSSLASPIAAKAPVETGPTASASIGISVSVAHRYGLAVGEHGSDLNQPGRGRYCLASNGKEIGLPVMLISVPEGQRNEHRLPSVEQAVQLAPCESTRRPLESAVSFDGPAGIREVIIRPD